MSPSNSPLVRGFLHFLASAIGGVVLAMIGMFAGGALFKGDANGFGDLIAAIFLGGAGCIVGSALAATIAGPRLGRPGPWWLAILAALLAAVVVMLLAEPLRLNTSTVLLQTVFVAACAAAAAFVPRLIVRR